MLDAFRPLVEAELGKPVEFVVHRIRIAGRYGFVAVEAQRPGGRPIDPARTPLGRRMQAEMGGLDVFDCCHAEAILQKTARGWIVRRHGVASTDVWYDGMQPDFPAGLLNP